MIKISVIAGILLASAIPGLRAEDPSYRATGDSKRHYAFAEAGEDSSYRLYVPASWTPEKRFPLVVMLHGGGLTQDAAFDREPGNLKGVVFREADKHRFILVAPMGYKGEYGNTFPFPKGQPPPPAGARPVLEPSVMKRNNELSEKDVFNVIDIVAKEYNTDPARTYLMGNSMGMLGTLSLAVKHAERWTAIGPSDGPGDAESYPYEKFKGIGGVMIVHGEADRVAPIAESRMIAAHIREQGVDTEFVSVPGGEHGTAWYMALPRIFDFFDKHPRRAGR